MLVMQELNGAPNLAYPTRTLLPYGTLHVLSVTNCSPDSGQSDITLDEEVRYLTYPRPHDSPFSLHHAQ